MKKALFILFLSVVSINSYCQSTIEPQHFITDKNPGEAFALSAVLPGAGQMYNGQVYIGLAVFAGDAALLYSGIQVLNLYNGTDYHTGNTLTTGTVLVTAGVVVYVAQLVYAPIYSQCWNKKNGFKTSSLNFNLRGSQLQLAYNF